MQRPHIRQSRSPGWTLRFARLTGAGSLRSLVVATALFVSLGLAGCIGLTGSSPLEPGGASADVSVTPSPVNFGNVVVGTSYSQTMTLSNTSKVSLTIASVTVSGKAFDASGIPTPLTLGVGDTATFTTSFKPAAAGTISGKISIKSDVSTVAVSLSGKGVSSAPQISVSTSTVSFGNVTLGAPASQQVVLKNTGNANLAISKVSASGTGFTASGGSGVTLTPDQSVPVTVTFDPAAAGTFTGGIRIVSDATNSPQITLSGAGVAAGKHSVTLNWNASASSVTGYFVYRGTTSGGPYGKLSQSLDVEASYKDSTVAGGETYYYVVTSVDSHNVESSYSNQVSVAIPSP
ncbi:MAG: choice-of-anchor D domain-containing protein [Candidatus Acidiferrales bacterium]